MVEIVRRTAITKTSNMGQLKPRKIRGLAKKPEPVIVEEDLPVEPLETVPAEPAMSEAERQREALRSLLPDFPLPEVPEFLWGRSNRRIPPIPVRLQVVGDTARAYKVAAGSLATHATQWVPKSQVLILNQYNEIVGMPIKYTYYGFWLPEWLAREKGFHQDNPFSLNPVPVGGTPSVVTAAARVVDPIAAARQAAVNAGVERAETRPINRYVGYYGYRRHRRYSRW